jgi:UDP-GlcNAc:undecaprenyl-phosphate GlcNAc-1-phosphate transferase
MALILLCGSFLCSVILTAVVRRWATRVGFVARPRNDRYHRTIIPMGGGIAITATIVLFLLAAIALVHLGAAGWLGSQLAFHTQGFIDKTPQLIVVVIAILALFAMGLADDRKRLGPYGKLVVQFAVAIAAAVFADIRVELFIPSKIVTTALSVLWIVFLINAFNFLDNMDGLSAGIAWIVTAVLLLAAIQSGQVFVSALALLVLGTLAGYLVFNFPPASIFMGDAGSLVIGFVVAMLSVRTTYYHRESGTSLYAVFLPLVVMAVPLYDFLSVSFLRIRQGKSPLVGDTQHFSHRLQRRGLSDKQTVLTLYLATIGTSIGGLLLHEAGPLQASLIFAQTVIILTIIAILEATGQKLNIDD